MNAVATNKKYLGIGDGGLCAISIFSKVQPQLYKQLQCKLKCKMLYQAVMLLFCKILAFQLANSCRNLLIKILLSNFNVFWR